MTSSRAQERAQPAAPQTTGELLTCPWCNVLVWNRRAAPQPASALDRALARINEQFDQTEAGAPPNDTRTGALLAYVTAAEIVRQEGGRDPRAREQAPEEKSAPAPQAPEPPPFNFLAHLARQSEWSKRTFGPEARTKGVCDHIRKELTEIEADPGDLKEWIDVAILALDGAWRTGASPEEIIAALVAKQTKNEGRQWPDWRMMSEDQAIEHVRAPEPSPNTQAKLQACVEALEFYTEAEEGRPSSVRTAWALQLNSAGWMARYASHELEDDQGRRAQKALAVARSEPAKPETPEYSFKTRTKEELVQEEALLAEEASKFAQMVHGAKPSSVIRDALTATRQIVADAAMTGFVCTEGDWAERLFANQHNLCAALSTLATTDEATRALDWLAKNNNVELSHSGWDDDVDEWRVHRVRGGRNDREWSLIATGKNPHEALARAAGLPGMENK